MERTESFWLSMAKKCEQRNRELDERQCTLHQRLETLKRKISLSHQNTSDSSKSSSCCMNMSSDSQSSESLLEESSQKLCPYKPKSSDDSLDLCCENPPDTVAAPQICPSKLMDIIKREKEMQQQIKNMEIKEKAFVDTLKRADKMYATLEKKYKKSLAKKGKGEVSKSSSTTQKLLEQNTYLSDQLKDAKLELKQCMENLEGPIARQLEQERRRSEQFQEKLQLASEEIENRDRRHTKDICNLQKKLVETSDNLAAVTEMNSNLQKQMCSLSRKCKELQKDLVDQKITEARTLECLVDGTSDKTSGLTKATQHSGGVENLCSIARKLSRTITDMSTCATCSEAVPQRLKNTMLGIVSIADVVSKKCKLTNAGDNSNDKRPLSPSTGKFGGGSTNVFYFTVDYSDRKFNQNKASENLSSQQTEIFIERGKMSQEEINQFKDKIENVKFECADKDDLQNTLIGLYKKNYDDVYDTMAFTSYGILEVITKSPVGIIETSTNMLSNNNVEVTTKLLNFYNELGKSELRNELTSLRDKISSIPVEDVLILKTKRDEEETTLRDFINIIPPAEPTPRTLGDPEIEMLYAEIGRNKIDELRMEIEVGEALSDVSEKKSKVVFQENFSNLITESFESRMNVEGSGIVIFNDTDSAEKNTKKIQNFQTKKKIHKFIKTTKLTPSKTKMSNEEECDCDLCLCDDCSPNVMRARANKATGKIDTDKQSQSIKISDSISTRMESDTLSTAKTVPRGDKTGPHPPDCDCVDCLCNPCASFPTDYKTRIHPPGCDCIDCLCTTLPCANFNPINKTAATQPPQSVVQPSPMAKCSVPVETPIECIENIPHNPDCNCDLCKCCECKKGKKPCGACDLEHHVSTCSCLDCLLTCGTRRLDREKQEVLEQKEIRENLPETELQEELDLTVPSPLAEESEKPLQPIENQELRAEPEIHKKVDYLEEREECTCKICNKVCESTCTMPTCKLASGDEKTNYKSKTFEIPKLKKKEETPSQTRQAAKLKKKEETHSQTRQAGGCDCVVCNDICNNPNCSQILIEQNQQNDKINRELKDLKVCLDNINSACAKAEAVCKPSKSKYGLLAFRNVVQNLQEKCVEKDKVVSTMIKDMKTRMENNFLCNLLGLSSKESDSLSSSDIYCCICDEKTKIENIQHNPCYCHWKILESSDSTSELSSCSCCTECEELRGMKPYVDPKTSDESCICSCESDSPNCCCSEKQDPIKHLEENILDDVYCCSYKNLNNESHSKKKLVCMQPNTFQKEIKNAPLAITEMRKIIDALLIKWSNPTCKNVIGYEVSIDGQVKSKIRSSKRTSTIIHSITSKKPITVTVYALTPSGRLLPGAKAVFDV